MIQAGVVENIVKGARGSGFGIARTEHHPCNSSVDDGPGAHHAGFERAIQRHAGEAVVCQVLRGLAHSDNFGVACGIVSRNGAVGSASDNLAVFGYDEGAHRNLSGRESFARLCQRLLHEEMIGHGRMLNYSAMKSLCSLALVLLLFPLGGFAQGVRMPADFFPLDVGTRWSYDLVNEAGQKVGQMSFAVEEYTIVAGTSFYALTEFPFSEERGEPVRLIRYDRGERQFMRKMGADEGPLFLDSGTTTEVLESDASGTAQKFLLRTDSMALTFQRGVGIVEAKLKGPAGLITAKMVSVQGRNVANAGPAAARDNATPPLPEWAIVPPPVPVPDRRRAGTTATVTSSNPRVDVGATPSAEGHDLVMVATNTSDRLLPFRFGSGQTYDFVIADATTGKEVWRWSRGQFFTQVVRSDSIRPNDKWRFDVVWDHRDNEGKKVAPGQYRLTGIITSLPEVHAVPVMLDVR